MSVLLTLPVAIALFAGLPRAALLLLLLALLIAGLLALIGLTLLVPVALVLVHDILFFLPRGRHEKEPSATASRFADSAGTTWNCDKIPWIHKCMMALGPIITVVGNENTRLQLKKSTNI